jgi:hypothetical protein
MPDSQSLARLPCPIHDDDSGRRRAEGSVPGDRGVRRSELTIISVIGEKPMRVVFNESDIQVSDPRTRRIRGPQQLTTVVGCVP